MNAPFEKGHTPTDTFAFEALSVTGAAARFTSSTEDPSDGQPAISATFQVQVAQIRYRLDGTDPTAAVGVLAQVGDEITIWGRRDIQSFRAIRTGGASAILATHFAR